MSQGPAWVQAIGSVAAIGVAIWIAHSERRRSEKMVETQQQERSRQRDRELLAARALLSQDLAKILNYAKQCSNAAMTAGDQIAQLDLNKRARVDCPELDIDVLVRIQRLVELLENELADHFVALMDCHQVQYSRLSGELADFASPIGPDGRERVFGKYNFEDTLEKTTELYLRATEMFTFARQGNFDTPVPPYPQAAVDNALRALRVDAWLTQHGKEKIMRALVEESP